MPVAANTRLKNQEKAADLAALRTRIRQLERLGGAKPPARPAALPLLAPFDALWPAGGLPLGCLHEARSDGSLAGSAALCAFAGCIAGRLGAVLWCARTRDAHGARLYAPGLAQIGLPAEKLLLATAFSDAALLAVMEEGLAHPLLGCVVGEVERLSLTASRRLQLAAEKSGVTALALRPSPRAAEAPIAAASRWRVTPFPSAAHAIAESGKARWRLELLQARCGAAHDWIVEAPDAQGHLRLSANVDNGFASAPAAHVPRGFSRRAAG
jgi:protein ImuA